MKIVIVGHHARRRQAERLAESMRAHLIMDDVGRGALAGHRAALEWSASQNERCVVMEDDALPVAEFERKAAQWTAWANDNLISLYLGTGRPPQYQEMIARLLQRADRLQHTYITLPQLIHGVCYSVPQGKVAALLSALPSTGAADFAVGSAWHRITRKPVIYPVRSLVDHDDGPSVEMHPDGKKRTEPRRAWRLEAQV